MLPKPNALLKQHGEMMPAPPAPPGMAPPGGGKLPRRPLKSYGVRGMHGGCIDEEGDAPAGPMLLATPAPPATCSPAR